MATPLNRNFRIEEYLKTNKQKSYFVISATVILIVAVVIFGLLPAYSAIGAQNKANKERDRAIWAFV